MNRTETREEYLTRRMEERGEDIEHLLTVIRECHDALAYGDSASAETMMREALKKFRRFSNEEHS